MNPSSGTSRLIYSWMSLALCAFSFLYKLHEDATEPFEQIPHDWRPAGPGFFVILVGFPISGGYNRLETVDCSQFKLIKNICNTHSYYFMIRNHLYYTHDIQR